MQTPPFLGAKAPLYLAKVSDSFTKKFEIGEITCSHLLSTREYLHNIFHNICTIFTQYLHNIYTIFVIYLSIFLLSNAQLLQYLLNICWLVLILIGSDTGTGTDSGTDTDPSTDTGTDTGSDPGSGSGTDTDICTNNVTDNVNDMVLILVVILVLIIVFIW